ncbi:MAG: hypothetical protein WBB29_11080 [Geitlerinemataceae cyanobacterium]
MLTSAYILRYRTGFSISSRSHTLELKWETNRLELGAGGVIVAKPKRTSPNSATIVRSVIGHEFSSD